MRRTAAVWFMVLLLISAWLPSRQVRAGGPVVPVILVHGYGGSPDITWGAALPHFEKAGYVRGKTLFPVQLTGGSHRLALFVEAGQVRAEIDRVLQATGAAQVDLVGHSQGGLIARILATGESASLVRRAVSIDSPHQGVLPDSVIDAMLAESAAPPYVRLLMPLPAHLREGSLALRSMAAREERFADRRSPALAIGSVWQEGALAVLDGHDGIVALTSQLAWPGAQTRTFRLGPSPEVLATRPDPFAIAMESPHAVSQRDAGVMQAVLDYLAAPQVASPTQPCGCPAFPDLESHWAAPTVTPYLPAKLPYTLAPDGRTYFEPNRAMTRAEFVYGLVRMKGLSERLQATPFADLLPHWALGYAESAREAGLVTGLAPDRFGPDEPLTRAQAAVLVVRALALAPDSGADPFGDTAGHWAAPAIAAAARAGIVQGDARGFRPEEPVTNAEGAVILIRAFGSVKP